MPGCSFATIPGLAQRAAKLSSGPSQHWKNAKIAKSGIDSSIRAHNQLAKLDAQIMVTREPNKLLGLYKSRSILLKQAGWKPPSAHVQSGQSKPGPAQVQPVQKRRGPCKTPQQVADCVSPDSTGSA